MKTLYESLLDDFDTLADNINYFDGLINPKMSDDDQMKLLRSLKPAIIDNGNKPIKKWDDILQPKPEQLFICYPSIQTYEWCGGPIILKKIDDTRFSVYYTFGDGRIKIRTVDMNGIKKPKIFAKNKLNMEERFGIELKNKINPPKFGEIYEFPEFLYKAWKKSKIESIAEEF